MKINVKDCYGKVVNTLVVPEGTEVEIVHQLSDAANISRDAKDHPDLEVKVEVTPYCITVGAAGYGDCTSNPGFGTPLHIEKYSDQLLVRVWADINEEEPTDRISLEGAREECRLDDGE